MKILILVLLSTAIFTVPLMAQKDVFMVILNKGENSYRSAGTDKPILLGTSLSGDDMIEVVEGGYVALVHEATGSSFELDTNGIHSVKQIEQNLLGRNTSVLAKYGKFLMNKLLPNLEGNQNLNVTGAVQRGNLDLIEVHLPKVVEVFENRVFISWQQSDDINDYLITLKDQFAAIIAKRSAKGNIYMLDLESAKLKDEQVIIFDVSVLGNDAVRSSDFMIKRLDMRARSTIEGEFSNLKKVTKSNNVVDNLLIASFFEESNLLADAIYYYHHAKIISPDPDGIDTLYDNFLERNKLKN